MSTDPRIDRTRTAVLRATADVLLESGCERLTIDEVAQRSGVARSTIYRNWGERSALLIDAVELLAEPHSPPETGTLQGDLTLLAERLAHHLSEEPLGRVLPSLIGAAACDTSLRNRLRVLTAERFAITRTVFEQAVLRCEIPPDDLDHRVERFLAPFFTRHLLHGWPLDEAFQAAQVDAALAPHP